MRTFNTGAYRDTNDGKLEYEGYLSPIVLQEFAKYMKRHQKQSNGEMRAADNWQKGFGDDHLGVCMNSAHRHFMDWWLEHRGYESREGIDEALAGLMFNLMAYWKKIIDDRK